MRGRDLFRMLGPVIEAVIAACRLLPGFIFTKTWWMAAAIPGIIGIGIRYVYARRLCATCGRNVLIGKRVHIDGWPRLEIGSNVSIHRDCYLDALGSIRIGSDVSIAHGCSLISFEHGWSEPNIPIRDNPLVGSPVMLENDVWIGAGAKILAGSHISSRVVVGAGAVVTGRLESHALYAGVPARRIKSII